MASHRSQSADTQEHARRGSSGSAARPFLQPLTQGRTTQQPGAPPGRIVASDFPASTGPTSPVLRFGQSQEPAFSPSSPWSRPRQGSEASLSSLGSQEGLGSAGGTHDDEDEDEDEDEDAPGQSVMAASFISQAALMLDPNLFLHAQEAWDQWNQLKGPGTSAIVDDEEAAVTGIASVAGESTIEQMSERASLLSSSLAQRKTYGAAPPLPEESAISSIRYRDRMLSAIHEHPAPAEATIRDAMTTADIGGQPGSPLGLILIAISQLCYSIMNLFVTLLDERQGENAPGRDANNPPMSALEIVFVECFIIWLGATAVMLLFKTPHVFLGPPGVRLLLLVRGMFGFLSTLFLYISLQSLSLSDATSITFLGPLVTGITAAVILGEPFSAREAVAGTGSLLGVLLIAKPSFLFGIRDEGNVPSSGGGDTPPIDDSDGTPRSNQRLIGVIIALLGVCSTSGAWVSLRKIGRSASTYHSISWFALCSWVFSLVGMAATGSPFVWPDSWLSAIFLCSVGTFSLGAQVFQTIGLQREAAGRAAVMSYLQIIFATLFQLVIIGTPLELLSVVGSVLILVNGAWVAASKGANAVGGH